MLYHLKVNLLDFWHFVLALAALFGQFPVGHEHLVVVALAGSFEDLERPVQFPVAVGVGPAVFGTQLVVLFGEPRLGRVVPAGSDVGAASVHPTEYRVGAQDGAVFLRLAGDVSIGAVAARYRLQHGGDVLGGEQFYSLGVARHRAFQLLLVVFSFVSTDALTASLLCVAASPCPFASGYAPAAGLHRRGGPLG